jgi:hypothetical protein
MDDLNLADHGVEEFELSHDLVHFAVIKQAGITKIGFNGYLETPIKLHEDLTNGCGGQLWPAGMVLAKYMLSQHSKELRGRSMCASDMNLSESAGC